MAPNGSVQQPRKYSDGAEAKRIAAADALKKHWRRWGPYLAERAWATVREDYSSDGDAWRYFPFEHAHQRAFRWGEDGIAGISDNHQQLCFALALWNGKDRVIKERLFGLTGHQGNHGEDVKELYYYVDNTPTHSYMKYLYKYPQNEFPYDQLVHENAKRTREEELNFLKRLLEEYELMDTGIFDEDRYFDVEIEYAKHASNVDDISIQITIHNRGPEAAPIHIIPQMWFRNKWSWSDTDYSTHEDEEDPSAPTSPRCSREILPEMPDIRLLSKDGEPCVIEAQSSTMAMYLHCDTSDGIEGPVPLFTENDTNLVKLYGVPNKNKYAKDGINDRIIHEDLSAVDLSHGTKTAAWYNGTIPAKSSKTIRLRFTSLHEHHTDTDNSSFFGPSFDAVLQARRVEADQFYASLMPEGLSEDMRNVQRQAYAGMLWSKQFYHFIVKDWLDGDKGQVAPPVERKFGRNKEWRHLHVDDILSMPDKWEYPFFACWDTAFHAVVFSQFDPWFAKKQLTLMTREWYLHPNGQLPAYEWNFSDVNPPVHAWAAYRIYKTEKDIFGREDRLFLERIFQKLLLNFTWWVNRKDADGLNVFEGGFLGLDNIAVFNRSEGLPTGGRLRQADGTSWMAMFCLNMLEIALELAPTNRSYEDIASKFFEHFLYISDALSWSSDDGVDSSLWNEEDGFYYDSIVFSDSRVVPLKVRSLVGLIPLFPVLVLEPEVINQCPDFKRRMNWFFENFDFTKRNVDKFNDPKTGEHILLALVPQDRLVRILDRMLDEEEFLSPYGIRSLSRFHKENPYVYYVGSTAHRVDYLPAESNSGLFGGNSNWRGPIWLSTTYLLIQSLQRFHHYYGDKFVVPCPSNGPKSQMMPLNHVADEIMHRLMRIFLKGGDGNRPVNGPRGGKSNTDTHFKDLILFYEYFDAESAKGLGASHQTGWTGLIAKIIQKA
ncbi:Six-hairpin glycosidase-like protein [Chytriomyces cf. hyalinus JEL632]|nr:Six-hairpin glycosidase-like protein [Chytriomyces cf. hyalinus JEL632]